MTYKCYKCGGVFPHHHGYWATINEVKLTPSTSKGDLVWMCYKCQGIKH